MEMSNRRRGMTALIWLMISVLALSALPLMPTVGNAATTNAQNTYYYQNDTQFKHYTRGILRPDQGTIEMTMHPTKPAAESGNDYEFAFSVTPSRFLVSGGNTLLGIYIPPAEEKNQLSFVIRKNGSESFSGSLASFAYTPGERVNVALTWNYSPSDNISRVRLYVNGIQQQLSTKNGTVSEVPMTGSLSEDLYANVLQVEKAEPFNVEQLKISTRELSASELLSVPDSKFKADSDTSLLVKNEMKTVERYRTNWHRLTNYHVLAPAWRAETQQYVVGENISFPMLSLNYSGEDLNYNVNIEATAVNLDVANTNNSPILSKNFTVQSDNDGKYAIHDLALPELNGEGYYKLKTTVSSGSSPIANYDSAIAVLPANDTSVTDGVYADFYGFHSKYDWDPKIWTDVNARITRTWAEAKVFLWNVVEPTKGAFYWEKSDQYVAKSKAAGLEVLGVLGYPSRWAATKPTDAIMQTSNLAQRPERWVPNDFEGEWANYIYQTVSRYKGEVKYWEIYNEVNFNAESSVAATLTGTDTQYMELLKIAYREVKRADPNARILTSGYSDHADNVKLPTAFFDNAALYQNGVNYFDIYNVHGYDGAKSNSKTTPWVIKLKQARPGTEYWMSEQMHFTTPDRDTRLYMTVEWFVDYLKMGYSKFINMGTFEVFFNRYTLSPEPDYYVLGVFNNKIRKVSSIKETLTWPGISTNTFRVRQSFELTNGKRLSILGANNTTAGAYEYELSGNIASAVDLYDHPITITTKANGNKVIQSSNIAYIESTGPIQVVSAVALESRPLLRNADFINLTGDVSMGMCTTIPQEWEYLYTASKGGSVCTVQGQQAGNYAVQMSATGQERVTIKQTGIMPTKSGTYRLSAKIKKIDGNPNVYLWFQGAAYADKQMTNLGSDYVTITKDISIDPVPNSGVTIGIGMTANSTGSFVVESLDFVNIDEAPQQVTMQLDASKKSYVSLAASANQSYSDETPAGDGQGGWADFGPENIANSNFQTGEQVIGGIPYQLPSSMTDPSVVMIAGGSTIRPNLPVSMTGIPVNQKLSKIGFLHTLMYPTVTGGTTVGNYIIHYADGTQVAQPIVFQQNIDDWYVPSINPAVVIAKKYTMSAGGERAVFNTLFTNPNPEKTITTIDMIGQSKAIIALMGITGEVLNS
ncbi:endo-1,4-beta-xylanase [Paenibacillus plantarum]|nr:endo-1,4-beta-xylanase [Paenibacillus plantarum]